MIEVLPELAGILTVAMQDLTPVLLLVGIHGRGAKPAAGGCGRLRRYVAWKDLNIPLVFSSLKEAYSGGM